MKAICPECGKTVKACRLIFGSSVKKEDDSPFYLSATHEPKEGFRKNQTISIPSGEIVETNCHGSMRPPKELVQEH